MKRLWVVLLSVYLVIGMISAYRAWFQVKSLTLETNDQVLRSGSVIHTSLVSYARTTIDVQVELIQGQHSETIGRQRLRGNEWAFFDPRNRQAGAIYGTHKRRFETIQPGRGPTARDGHRSRAVDSLAAAGHTRNDGGDFAKLKLKDRSKGGKKR